MQSDLQQLFNESENRRVALVRAIAALNSRQAAWSVSETGWSIQQIVLHLALSDETVGRARSAEEISRERGEFGIVPRVALRSMVLEALRRNVVLPLPSDAVEPAADVGLRAALDRWEAARQSMRRDLENLGSSGKPRYSHPVLGSLTAEQMLQLEREHGAYHARQILALRDHPAFP